MEIMMHVGLFLFLDLVKHLGKEPLHLPFILLIFN